MVMSIEDRLRSAQGDFEAATIKKDTPDGIHQMMLTKVKIHNTEKTFSLQWTWKCVSGGEGEGSTITEFTPLEGDLIWLSKTKLADLGVKISDWSSLEKYLPQIDGIVIEAEISSRRSERNGKVYTNKNISIRKVVVQSDSKGAEKPDKAEDNAKSAPKKIKENKKQEPELPPVSNENSDDEDW